MNKFLQKIRTVITGWWAEFNIQTRLMAAATLVVSLLMSALTFWAVNSIQQDARLQDTRFGQDLGLLLSANVVPLVADHRYSDLAQFSRKFYRRTSSIRYMLYADEEGKIFYGLPFSEAQINSALTLKRRIQLPDSVDPHAGSVMVRQHMTPNGEVADVFVPLFQEELYLGYWPLALIPTQQA